ncbi:MAG: hypothetical protein DGJ47_000304 [Rickettsiaceae bacterium]
MKRVFINIVALLLLSGCGEMETPNQTPASEQIKNYTKELEDCQEETAKKVKDQISTEDNKDKHVLEKTKKNVDKFALKDDDIILGDKNAKVTLIEYFSPTCPHCVHFHKRIFPEIKKKYINTGKVLYVSREFIGNKQDLDATLLAKCSDDVDTYYKFMDVLLMQQSNWAYTKNYREVLTNIGALGGILPEKYAKCLKDKKRYKSLVENTMNLARESHFVGTPAFIINNELHVKSYSLEDLSKTIDKLLKP